MIEENNPLRLWLVAGVIFSVVVIVTVEFAIIGRVSRGRWAYCGIECGRGREDVVRS
jgi:hypothetical protein